MSQLRACIEKGLTVTSEARQSIAHEVLFVRAVGATVDAKTGPVVERRAAFEVLQRESAAAPDEGRRRMGELMARWAPGLFDGDEEFEKAVESGASLAELPEDNYALERFFRLPKHHERHIHGRAHVGISLVRSGATRTLALDAHRHHPTPFTHVELAPYREARMPAAQRAALERGRVMRRGRSPAQRPQLLADLEARYERLA